MKSEVIPIYKEGQNCILTVDKEINDTTVKKGSIVTIEAIELTDSKFAELDEIYFVDYIDYTFWVYQTELKAMKSDFSNGCNFSPDEKRLYDMCVKSIREAYNNPYVVDELIRDEYNSNRNPNMRSLEEIEFESKL